MVRTEMKERVTYWNKGDIGWMKNKTDRYIVMGGTCVPKMERRSHNVEGMMPGWLSSPGRVVGWVVRQQ